MFALFSSVVCSRVFAGSCRSVGRNYFDAQRGLLITKKKPWKSVTRALAR
jgi:hypothetical protein